MKITRRDVVEFIGGVLFGVWYLIMVFGAAVVLR